MQAQDHESNDEHIGQEVGRGGGAKACKAAGSELSTGTSSSPALQPGNAGKEELPVHTSRAAQCSTYQQDAVVCTPHCRASHLTAYLGLLGLSGVLISLQDNVYSHSEKGTHADELHGGLRCKQEEGCQDKGEEQEDQES